MFRNKSVDVHRFAMVPRADVPRSKFRIEHSHKTTFDAGYLVPIYLDEILPGDTFNCRMTAFARLATPLFPIMDNMYLDSFFFFVPSRLLWDNWQRFMGEQPNPGDSTSFIIPKVTSPVDGYPVNSLFDYFGLSTVGQLVAGTTMTTNVLPLRAYNLIWNEWFRDENLQDQVPVNTDDGPDPYTDYTLLRRGKRHDYFTSCLPWPQKGESVALPLGLSAPVLARDTVTGPVLSGPDGVPRHFVVGAGSLNASMSGSVPAADQDPMFWYDPGLVADLSQATAATINQLRQSFQIQRLLERDARGGTRYTELLRAHFGVVSPDARLQRPEYLGGGSTPVTITPIAQTSGTAPAPDGYSDTPQGNLAAIGTALARNHGFTQSFVEHGYVIGLVCVRSDLNYQQGQRRLWARNTRYDFYWPAFSHLGEQAVYSAEIFSDGSGGDFDIFGYQERWAEYRYHPSMVTGLFRSTSAGTLDAWHLAQRFNLRPVLNEDFIVENPPVERVVSVGAAAQGQQFIFDSFFRTVATRPMPLYSVPGLIDHF